MDGERILRGLIGLGVVACIALFIVGFAAPVLPPEIAGFMHGGANAAPPDLNATPAAMPAAGAASPDESGAVPTSSAMPTSDVARADRRGPDVDGHHDHGDGVGSRDSADHDRDRHTDDGGAGVNGGPVPIPDGLRERHDGRHHGDDGAAHRGSPELVRRPLVLRDHQGSQNNRDPVVQANHGSDGRGHNAVPDDRARDP